jgi:hypothetical protein
MPVVETVVPPHLYGPLMTDYVLCLSGVLFLRHPAIEEGTQGRQTVRENVRNETGTCVGYERFGDVSPAALRIVEGDGGKIRSAWRGPVWLFQRWSSFTRQRWKRSNSETK